MDLLDMGFCDMVMQDKSQDWDGLGGMQPCIQRPWSVVQSF